MRAPFFRTQNFGTLFVPWFLLGFYLAAMLNWHASAGLRFTSPLLNSLTLIADLLLPLLTLLFIVWRWQGTARLAGAIILTLPAFLSLALTGVVTCFASPHLSYADDPSFEQKQEVALGRYHVAVYRTNGGATTAFGIVVQQELPLFLHLRLAREVYRSYPATQATVRVTGPGTISVSTDNPKTPGATTVRLQPLIFL